MDKASYILNNIYHLHALAGRILDGEGKLKTAPFEGFSECDPVLASQKLHRELMEVGRNGTQDRYRIWNDGGYWYYVFHGTESYVIWGPVIFEEHTKYEQNLYGKRLGVKGDICTVPLTDIRRLEETVAFAHGLLFEEYGQAVVIEHGKVGEKFQGELLSKYSEYGLQNVEWGREHHSFMREHQMWKWIIEGELGTEEQRMGREEPGILFEDVVKSAGVMSESPTKNIEYGAVVGITLLTRYAIAAGVDENAAYALSDVALQELSKTADVMEMARILDDALHEFMRLNREMSLKSQSLYVEQSREYIARHIYEKFSLPEIAEEIGLHPGYLSRIFTSQTGMTLMEYVMQEKVRISCNLLKYSNRSIAVIAEYVSLSPQSYFTRVFKKVTGETPAKYRKTHVDKNFLES